MDYLVTGYVPRLFEVSSNLGKPQEDITFWPGGGVEQKEYEIGDKNFPTRE